MNKKVKRVFLFVSLIVVLFFFFRKIEPRKIVTAQKEFGKYYNHKCSPSFSRLNDKNMWIMYCECSDDFRYLEFLFSDDTLLWTDKKGLTVQGRMFKFFNSEIFNEKKSNNWKARLAGKIQ